MFPLGKTRRSGEFADCWVFKTPLLFSKNNFPYDVPVGSAPGCDNFMFLLLKDIYKYVFNWAEKYKTYHYDIVRKPEIVINRTGKMIMNDDVVWIDRGLFESNDRSTYTLSPYYDWQNMLEEIKNKTFVISPKTKIIVGEEKPVNILISEKRKINVHSNESLLKKLHKNNRRKKN
jgi:hypothetical protein